MTCKEDLGLLTSHISLTWIHKMQLYSKYSKLKINWSILESKCIWNPKVEMWRIREYWQYLLGVLQEMQLPSHHSLQDLWSMYCKLILPQGSPIYSYAGKELHERQTMYQVSATSIKRTFKFGYSSYQLSTKVLTRFMISNHHVKLLFTFFNVIIELLFKYTLTLGHSWLKTDLHNQTDS